MMAEKVIAIFGLIFVTSFVAKYIGPSLFGQIAFFTSLFQIVQVISQLGSDVVIFKRISINKTSGINLINSTLSVRVLVYFLFSLPILIYGFFTIHKDGYYFLIAVFISLFISSIDLYSVYYDSLLKSRVNTFINIAGLIISLLTRWFIAFFSLDPRFLVIPIIVSTLIPFLVRFYFFKRDNYSLMQINARKKRRYRRYLVLAGSTFVVSSISVTIYSKLSTLMLGFLTANSQVGIFSISSTLAGAWSFVALSFITSSFPAIFNEKDESIAIRKVANLAFVVILICLCVILGIYIFGEWFINIFYGEQYLNSYEPALILSFSTLLSLLGVISSRFIARHSGYLFLSKKSLFVTIVSLFLNFVLIYKYGVFGAVFAALITELLSLTILNYFYKHGMLLKVHLKFLSYKRVE